MKYIIALFFCLPLYCSSQLIQDYFTITEIDTCNWTLTLDAPISTEEGEHFLIHQSLGGDCSITTDDSFGEFIDDGKLGSYEVIVSRENTNSSVLLSIENKLLNSYSVGNGLQLVKGVSSQNDIVIDESNGTGIISSPWNGTTGGLIFIHSETSVELKSDITINGSGFSGGTYVDSPFECNWLTPKNDYYYEVNTGFGANKGNGIVAFPNGFEAGKGNWANAGGGSNDHNAGGGGGAGYGNGGQGGDRLTTSMFLCSGSNPGLGGRNFSGLIENNRLVFGGAGGAGHGNNNEGTGGENGGGIIIIQSPHLITSGVTISAKGNNITNSAGDDGAGGAGGGGIVFLDVNDIIGDLFIDVSGGKGGDNAGNPNLCSGSGGGGGGGAILISNSSFSSNITTNIDGGLAGINTPCTLNGPTTVEGSDGAVLFNHLIPESNLGLSLAFITVSDSIICNDIPLTLTANGIVDNIQWSPISLFSDSSLTVQNITLAETTDIYLFSQNGFCSTSDSISIQVEICTAQEEIVKEELKLIDWMYTHGNTWNINGDLKLFEVFDLQGRQVFISTDKSFQLNLVSGIYIVKASFYSGRKETARFYLD